MILAKPAAVAPQRGRHVRTVGMRRGREPHSGYAIRRVVQTMRQFEMVHVSSPTCSARVMAGRMTSGSWLTG